MFYLSFNLQRLLSPVKGILQVVICFRRFGVRKTGLMSIFFFFFLQNFAKNRYSRDFFGNKLAKGISWKIQCRKKPRIYNATLYPH